MKSGVNPIDKSEILAVTLFLVSASGLIFEIALTRLFSLLFQYHYVFLAISLAVLGLGLGAALARFLPPAPDEKELLPALLALSISFPLAAALLAWLPSAASILLHALVALLPFVLTGLFAAQAFSRFSTHSGLLYGADLLGAAVGVFAVLGLLDLWGAFNVVIFLGVVAALAALILSLSRDSATSRRHLQGGGARGEQGNAPRAPSSARRHYRLGALLCLAFSGGLLAFNLSSALIDFFPARLSGTPRDKTMVTILHDRSQSARIVYSAWDPFARVDVVETNDPEVKFVFTDGGAGSFMYRFDGDLKRLAPLRDSLEFLPFAVGPVKRTLILGAGAGKDVLLALLAKADTITAVEVNPAMVEATRRFADFNGYILERPEVHLVVGDARTFVERNPEHYDLIYLNLVYTQAAEPASQALVESYIFTRQAFQAYLDHLTSGGRLAIISHSALEGSRAAITGLQVLADAGQPLPQALRHLALLMYPAEDPTQRTTVMVLGKEPLQDEEVRELAAGAKRLGLQPLFLPGLFELPFAPLLQGASLEEFLAGDPTYDLSPTDDDRPFFFQLNPGLPAPLRGALGTALGLAGLIVGLTIWQGARGQRSGDVGGLASFVAYLTLIGLGFMLVEVSLIQRFQLLLGQPVLSFALVLGALLLGSGLGSLTSQRVPSERLVRLITWISLAIGGLVVLYLLALPALVRPAMAASLPIRGLVIVALILPLGYIMGMPFPSGLRLARRLHSDEISLLWGVNGVFSVLGSILAVVTAMKWGFSRALALGAGCYLGLSILLVWMTRMDRRRLA